MEDQFAVIQPDKSAPDEEEYEDEKPVQEAEQFCYYVRQSEFILLLRLAISQLVGAVGFMTLVFIVTQYQNTLAAVWTIGSLIFVSVTLMQAVNLLVVLFLVLSWLKSVFVIRVDRIIVRRGIFHVVDREYSTQRVESVNVSQGILGRVFGYGTVTMFNPVLKEDMVLENIPHPYIYAQVIAKRQAKEAVRFFPRIQGA